MLLHTKANGIIEIRPGQEIEINETLDHPYLRLEVPPKTKRVKFKEDAKPKEEEVEVDG